MGEYFSRDKIVSVNFVQIWGNLEAVLRFLARGALGKPKDLSLLATKHQNRCKEGFNIFEAAFQFLFWS